MSVRYVARKCTQCAGKLEYIKDKKTWKCLYCGAEIERAEQYDGLFTIKNVVRQVLLDVAYRRLDSAQKNLVECEKIDSRYVGTIIAKIAYQMITAITPDACPQAELRNLFAQMKRNYETLQSIDKNISGDEEALYEFFDSADVYATLLLVFDSLNDTVRRDYVSGLLSGAEVYSREPNKNLLSYALKNAKYVLIDEIMSNPDNVEPGFALDELLQKYPDNENKIRNIEGLLKGQTFKSEDKIIIERYLVESADALSTKGKILGFAYSANIKPGLEEIVAHVLSKADKEIVEAVLGQVCGSRLTDDDVYKIVEFAISARSRDIAISALTALKDTNQYVLMTPKCIITLLSRTDLTAADKIDILNKMLEFNIDVKSKNAIISNYLCYNNDNKETRLVVIPALLNTVTTIQTNIVENYVLTVNTDGLNKPVVVKQIFSLDLNMSFFNDLLIKYMNSAVDIKEVKDTIVSLLVGKGLKIDQKALIDYICYGTDPVKEKITFVKQMLANGMQLRGDTVNAYLETQDSEKFNSELFSLIVGSADNVSENALSNYLLFRRDSASLKVKNFIALTGQCHKNIADIRCVAMCAGQRISGNLLPVYILTTPDSFEVSKRIADYLINYKSAKLNAEIQSSGAGSIKMKKFVSANTRNLSAVSAQICAAYKIG